MDHSHHDRTYKKSRFQQELEQSVSRKLISSLLLGCLLFCIAIAAVNALNQNARREDHLESVASTFHAVYITTSQLLWRYSSSLPTPRERFGSRPFRRER